MYTISRLGDFNTDYFEALESTKLTLMMEELYYDEIACMEDFIVLKTGTLVLEDVAYNPSPEQAEKNKEATTTRKSYEGITNMISKFVQFIKDITNKFMNKFKELTGANDKWINSNVYKIDGIKPEFWKDCTVTCYPYHMDKGDIALFSKDIFSNGSNFKNYNSGDVIKKVSDGFKDDKALRQYVSDVIYKLNEDNFIDGAKQFFRGDKEVKKFSATEAQKICQNFGKYLKHYKETVNNIRNAMNKVSKLIEDTEKTFKKELKEGYISADSMYLYSILEDAFIESLNVIDQFGNPVIIFEDGNATEGNEEQKPATGNNVLKNRMKYWKLVMDMQTSRMTIAEECYTCGIKTLKSVIRNAENNGLIAMGNEENKSEEKPAEEPKEENK